jgi:hypothetical protein
LALRNKCYESDEIPQVPRPLKKQKGSTEESKSYSRKTTPAFFLCPLKMLVYAVQDTGCLLNAKHLDEPIDFIAHKNISLCSYVSGIHQPTKPVWGEKYMYSTVAVEQKNEFKPKAPVQNTTWNYYLGFGQRFLVNASQDDDGIVYYCAGYASRVDCQRLRYIIMYLVLSTTAEEKLSAKVIKEVYSTPLRTYQISSIIPGTIVPRVVGTILDADQGTQELFFKSVTSIFSPGATLPFNYKLDPIIVKDIKEQSYAYRKNTGKSSFNWTSDAVDTSNFDVEPFYSEFDGSLSQTSERSTVQVLIILFILIT